MYDETAVRLVNFVFHHGHGLVLQDWRDEILSSLFNKDPKDFFVRTIEGFLFFRFSGKVFSRVLLNCLLKYIAPMIPPEPQCVFQPNRGKCI